MTNKQVLMELDSMIEDTIKEMKSPLSATRDAASRRFDELQAKRKAVIECMNEEAEKDATRLNSTVNCAGLFEKFIMDALGLVAKSWLDIWTFKKGLEFEETGTVTSLFVRRRIDKIGKN